MTLTDLSDRAFSQLGSEMLYEINCRVGMGDHFVDVIDKIQATHRYECSLQDIQLARSWWAAMLPTPSLRRFARRLSVLLSKEVLDHAKAGTHVTVVNREVSSLLDTCDGTVALPPISAKELYDLRTFQDWNSIHNPELIHPWAALVVFVLRARPLPQCEEHRREQFRFWVSSEIRLAGLRYSGSYYSFFAHYIDWLFNHNPISTDRNRK